MRIRLTGALLLMNSGTFYYRHVTAERDNIADFEHLGGLQLLGPVGAVQ